jgi:hypothetical protein
MQVGFCEHNFTQIPGLEYEPLITKEVQIPSHILLIPADASAYENRCGPQ